MLNLGAARSTAGVTCQLPGAPSISFQGTLAVTPSPSFDVVEIQVEFVVPAESVDVILDLGLADSVLYLSIDASVSLWLSEAPVPCELFLERGQPASVVLPSQDQDTFGVAAADLTLEEIAAAGTVGSLDFTTLDCVWDDAPPLVECNAMTGCSGSGAP